MCSKANKYSQRKVKIQFQKFLEMDLDKYCTIFLCLQMTLTCCTISSTLATAHIQFRQIIRRCTTTPITSVQLLIKDGKSWIVQKSITSFAKKVWYYKTTQILMLMSFLLLSDIIYYCNVFVAVCLSVRLSFCELDYSKRCRWIFTECLICFSNSDQKTIDYISECLDQYLLFFFLLYVKH